MVTEPRIDDELKKVGAASIGSTDIHDIPKHSGGAVVPFVMRGGACERLLDYKITGQYKSKTSPLRSSGREWNRSRA